MNLEQSIARTIGLALLSASLGIAASNPSGTSDPAQMVVTIRSTAIRSTPGAGPLDHLEASELTASEGNTRVPVVSLNRLPIDLTDTQLFIFLDDSTPAATFGTHLPELKEFLRALPAPGQIAIGYMRNGSFVLAQSFSTNHDQAAKALRLPMSMPGANGSPYFALSDLVKHWPSKEPSGRRAVLMLTDGVDGYSGPAIVDDPYADAAINDALKEGVTVYSIYLRGPGLRSTWVTNVAQSRLAAVSDETGGYAYFQGFSNPVTISPFLADFQDRLENQYRVTLEALSQKGVQPIKLRTEVPGVNIEAPTRIYVRYFRKPARSR